MVTPSILRTWPLVRAVQVGAAMLPVLASLLVVASGATGAPVPAPAPVASPPSSAVPAPVAPVAAPAPAPVVAAAPAPALSAPGLVPLAPVERWDQAPAEETVQKGYGGQILLTDLAGLAIISAGGGTDQDWLATAGLLTMAFGPAAVHLAHDRPQAALASALMRPGLTMTGVFVGASMASCHSGEWFCGLGEAMLGGLVGYGAAAVIDAAYLARERRVVRGPARAWAPQVAASPAGVRLGVGGTF